MNNGQQTTGSVQKWAEDNHEAVLLILQGTNEKRKI